MLTCHLRALVLCLQVHAQLQGTCRARLCHAVHRASSTASAGPALSGGRWMGSSFSTAACLASKHPCLMDWSHLMWST